MISIILCICVLSQPLFKRDLLPVFLLLEQAYKTLLYEYDTADNRIFFRHHSICNHYISNDNTNLLKVKQKKKRFPLKIKPSIECQAQ